MERVGSEGESKWWDNKGRERRKANGRSRRRVGAGSGSMGGGDFKDLINVLIGY